MLLINCQQGISGTGTVGMKSLLLLPGWPMRPVTPSQRGLNIGQVTMRTARQFAFQDPSTSRPTSHFTGFAAQHLVRRSNDPKARHLSQRCTDLPGRLPSVVQLARFADDHVRGRIACLRQDIALSHSASWTQHACRRSLIRWPSPSNVIRSHNPFHRFLSNRGRSSSARNDALGLFHKRHDQR